MRKSKRTDLFAIPLIFMMFLFLSGQCIAQNQVESATTSELAFQALMSDINSSLKNHADDASDEPIFDKPYHIIILFNSTQVEYKPPYTELSRKVVKRLLSTLLENQVNKQWIPSSRYLVSFYPYQLDLYTSSSYSVFEVPLTDTVPEMITKKIPLQQLRMRGDSKTKFPQSGGHDNTGALVSLVNKLENQKKDPQLIIIQITDIAIDQTEKNYDQNRTIISKLDLVEYPSLKSPVKTDETGDDDKQRYDVWYYIYGPRTVQIDINTIESKTVTLCAETGLLASDKCPNKVQKTIPANKIPVEVCKLTHSKPFNWYILWIIPIVIALAVISLSWFSKQVTIIIGSERQVLKRYQSIEIWGPGDSNSADSPKKNAIILPNSIAKGAPRKPLAVIRYDMDVTINQKSFYIQKGALKQATIKLVSDAKGNDIVLTDGRYAFNITINVQG